MPSPVVDTGTPIYDALARSWREQGRQLPRPADSYSGWAARPEQSPRRPATGRVV
ncbi:hypothetical protein [Streptomyces sp. NPDC058657]|uniref:hypothetical protein n=1 Tax=unclassified Streptomyces TaxID=2593676 RepID=UPI00365E2EF9